MELIKNRKLNSYIYKGWRIKDALHNAVKNPDVRLNYERRLIGGKILDEKCWLSIPYLIADDNHRSYKLKLTNDEAEYYKFLKISTSA